MGGSERSQNLIAKGTETLVFRMLRFEAAYELGLSDETK